MRITYIRRPYEWSEDEMAEFHDARVECIIDEDVAELALDIATRPPEQKVIEKYGVEVEPGVYTAELSADEMCGDKTTIRIRTRGPKN